MQNSTFDTVRVKPVVYVVALSYKRPQGIAELLAGLRCLVSPKGWDVRFLIVDNDHEGSAREPVERAMPLFGGRLCYVIEPEPGIPAARNRALREAIEGGAKLLCFIDDDQTSQPDWLEELIAHWRETGAELIGGPVRRSLSPGPVTPFHRFFAKSLIARRALAERRAAKLAAVGKPVLVTTGNWMCDLSIVRDGLCFDGSLWESGGEDAAFYRAALKRGFKVSWCSTAISTEPIAADRLSVRYQYKRSRDQGIVMARLRQVSPIRALLEQAPQGTVGVGLLFVPVLGIASFATGLHLIGWAMGHLAYLKGRESSLYARQATATG